MVEGDDGKLSYRRIAQLLFLFLIAFIILKGVVKEKYGYYGLIVLCLTFIILAGVITAQQIIAAMQQANQLKSGITGLVGKLEVKENDKGTTPEVTDQP
jgi:hypothetical protein